jgi:hypothetical protein
MKHDAVLGSFFFIVGPSAIIACVLWIAGFLQLHQGEKKKKN